jgi:hypothetical protein
VFVEPCGTFQPLNGLGFPYSLDWSSRLTRFNRLGYLCHLCDVAVMDDVRCAAPATAAARPT